MSSTREPDQDFSTTFARGLAVICCFSREHPTLSVSEAAALAKMSRAAARRFLLTLAELGYATHDGKRFRLAPRVLDLGYGYLSAMGVWDVAQPLIEELSNEVHESCGASVLDGTDIVHVIHVAPRRIVSAFVTTGTRQPAHATALGRVHLAALSREELDAYFRAAKLTALTRRTITTEVKLRRAIKLVRDQDYALVDQELEEGLRAIAVPIRDRADKVIAALVVSCHAGRVDVQDMIQMILPRLRGTATAIRNALPTRMQPVAAAGPSLGTPAGVR